MRGWKPVERHVPDAMRLEDAKRLLQDRGFSVHVDNPQHAILRRSGTELSVSGEKFPLEVALASAEEGLYMQARYDAFVAFDTGDLERFADELAADLSG